METATEKHHNAALKKNVIYLIPNATTTLSVDDDHVQRRRHQATDRRTGHCEPTRLLLFYSIDFFLPRWDFLGGLIFFFFHEPPVRQGNLKAPLYYFLTGVFVWKMGKYQERTFTGKGIFCKKLKKSWKSLNNDAYNNKTTWLNASIIFV